MATTQERLLQLMAERGLKQKDIVDKAQPFCRIYNERFGAADMSAYINGKYLPAQKKIAILARALNVTEGWLMGLDVPKERELILKTRKVPILGDTAAGAPITAERVYDEYVELPADGKRYDAAVHITGDSMEPTYRLGDLALLRYQPDVENGEAAVICIDDTVTLKRVYHVGDKVMLQSDNPKYQPIIVDENTCNNAHIVGKVVGFVHWEE